MTLSRNRTKPDAPHDVYRCLDDACELIYVGISGDAYARLRRHRLESPWWRRVQTVTVDRYRNRPSAFAVEAAAIRDECPTENRKPGHIIFRGQVDTLPIEDRHEFEVCHA